jgi:hypothetical protein
MLYYPAKPGMKGMQRARIMTADAGLRIRA